MEKKLKTLDEHNLSAWDTHSVDFKKPIKNGIACPKCGMELYDTSPFVTLASNPPQKNIGCIDENGCGWVGFRIA